MKLQAKSTLAIKWMAECRYAFQEPVQALIYDGKIIEAAQMLLSMGVVDDRPKLKESLEDVAHSVLPFQ